MNSKTLMSGIRPLLTVAIVLLPGFHPVRARAQSDITIKELQCEGIINPLGIESASPGLTWIMSPRAHSLRGVRQSAYRVIVATTLEKLIARKPDMWDSGKVESDTSVRVPYGGKKFASATRAWWMVQTWDQKDEPSEWSPPAHWDTGLLADSDWQAKWIAAPPEVEKAGAPCLRKSITLRPGWTTVRAFVCGLGYHELNIDGVKVDTRVLEPAQTEYPKRTIYSAYDVTAKLPRSGHFVIGVMLGNGWYNQDRVWGGMSYGHPILKLRLEAEYPDGSRSSIVSDGSWATTSGPVISNNIYAGESFDARKTINWRETGATHGAWLPVVLAHGPEGRLVCPTFPPIRPLAVLQPTLLHTPPSASTVFDMGQNFAGWARLKLSAPAGTSVTMRFSEAIDEKSGRIDTASTGVFATGVEQIDNYICRGGSPETWEPRFIYHGFRYVEVTGLPAGSPPPQLTGIVVHTDVRPSGEFVCSDPMVNRIHRTAVWTVISNLHGHPTDCPARERCGWLGDSHACAEMAAMNFDMSGFWTKYIDDIDAGWVKERPPYVVPGKRIAVDSGPIDWGVAVVMLPWFHWLYYGDKQELERCYPLMSRFVTTVSKLADKDGLFVDGLGDWCPPGSVEPTATPPALTTTAWFVEAARRTAQVAAVLNRTEDARIFAAMAQSATAALQAKFFDAGAHSLHSQTADAMALAFNLIPESERQAVTDTLSRDVAAHDNHHTTGIFGSRWLFDSLTKGGYGSTAMAVMHKTDYPSIGNLFARGATTFWECWGEAELDKKWGARSLNHPMQAGYDAWFYQGAGGINADPAGPGFKRILIRPYLPPGLEFVSCYHDTQYGRIRSDWKRTKSGVAYRISIPLNTTATISLPLISGDRGTITESGHSLSHVQSVNQLTTSTDRVTFTVSSGDYLFKTGK